jgi:hypothetical protein
MTTLWITRGPGAVERKIIELFAESHDRAIDADEIARLSFGLAVGETRTRVQRNSAIRAAHRVIRHQAEMNARGDALRDQGREQEAQQLWNEVRRIGEKTRLYRKAGDREHIYADFETWRATLISKGRPARLVFQSRELVASLGVLARGEVRSAR